MKNFRTAIYLFAAATLTACAGVPQSLENGKKLVWHDEFNGKGLPDSSKWKFETGGLGFGNNELQYYTENQMKNARQEGGNLIIEAHKEKFGKNDYTSAKLVTKGIKSWTYGTVEVRAKLPKGRGTWPAIWMMSERMKEWPDDGEIDIMEHVGYRAGYVHGSLHSKNYNHIIGTQKTDTIYVKDVSEVFHVYRMDWSAEKIDMYVDGEKFFTAQNTKEGYDGWPFDQPFYLILNQAVGGNWGGKEGVDESIYPQKYYIDYVRIYQ